MLNLIDHEDIAITLLDGTGTPVSLALTMEKASLAVDNLIQGGIAQEVVPITRRGKIQALKRGDRAFSSGSLSGVVSRLQGSEMHNFLLRREAYVANVTTAGAGQKVYTVNIVVTVNEKVYDATVDNQEFTLVRCHGTLSIGEEENGVVAVTYSFTTYGGITSRELLTPTPAAADPLQAERA